MRGVRRGCPARLSGRRRSAQGLPARFGCARLCNALRACPTTQCSIAGHTRSVTTDAHDRTSAACAASSACPPHPPRLPRPPVQQRRLARAEEAREHGDGHPRALLAVPAARFCSTRRSGAVVAEAVYDRPRGRRRHVPRAVGHLQLPTQACGTPAAHREQRTPHASRTLNSAHELAGFVLHRQGTPTEKEA